MSKQILDLPVDGRVQPLEFDWADAKHVQFSEGPERLGDGSIGDSVLTLTVKFDRASGPKWLAARDV